MTLKYYDETKLNRKLPTDVKERWLTALRSGNYKQVKSALRKLRSDKEIGYCCLGVLSDIYVQDKLALNPTCNVGWAKEPNREKAFPLTASNGTVREAMPTREVNDWAKRGADGWLVYVDEKDAKKFFPDSPTRNFVDIASLNDGGRSFKTIAAVIEKYL